MSFTSQEWAQCYLEKYPRAVRVSSIAEVSELLRTPEAVESDTSGRRQMALGLG